MLYTVHFDGCRQIVAWFGNISHLWGGGGGLRAQSRQSARIFLQSSELGTPHPLTRRRVCPPPPYFVPWGGGDTLACGRGDGEGGSNSYEETDTVVSIIYVLCG